MKHRPACPAYRPLSLVLLTVVLQGCVRWSAIPLEPQRPRSEQRARATLRSGERTALYGWSVTSDSLVWGEGVDTWSTQPSARRAVPLVDVERIEVHRVDVVASALLVLGIGLIVVGLTTVDPAPQF